MNGLAAARSQNIYIQSVAMRSKKHKNNIY